MIRIEIDDRAVLDALNDLRARLADLTPVMANIAQALENETEYRFEREGPGWPRLAESTILQRIKEGKWPGKMLQRTAGGLADSIESRHGRDFAEIGSNKVYAAIHQIGAEKGAFGTGKYKTRRGSFPIPWGDIPPRPYLPIDADGQLTESAQATILEIIQAYLEG